MHRLCSRGLMPLVLGLLAGGSVAAEQPAAASVQTHTYKRTKEGDLALHVHLPPGWKPADRRPVIIFFFGGGWTNGTVKQFEPQATYLAGRGMAAVRADYRVKARQGVTPDACVADARSAVRWLRQNAAKLGIDPDRVVAAGGSAGGHLAACTACPGGRRMPATTRASPIAPMPWCCSTPWSASTTSPSSWSASAATRPSARPCPPRCT